MVHTLSKRVTRNYSSAKMFVHLLTPNDNCQLDTCNDGCFKYYNNGNLCMYLLKNYKHVCMSLSNNTIHRSS